MKVDKILVKTDKTSYQIIVGNGAINLLRKQIIRLCPETKKIAIIFDKNVPNTFKIKIKKLLKKYKIFIKDYYPKEELKTFPSIKKAKKLMLSYIEESKVVLEKYGSKAQPLIGLCESLSSRKS